MQIYLIEEHADKHTDETFGQTISTIKSSLQVIDNIQVHIAMNVAEVCSYLALLTRTFRELHSVSRFSRPTASEECAHVFASL